MELQTPGEYHETPEPHELSGIRRGHFARLKLDGAFFWAMVREVRYGEITGIVESSFPGGPERGAEIVFRRKHIFEIH